MVIVFFFPFSLTALCAIFSSAEKPTIRKSQDGKVFKRITGRLCQTTQDKEITFTNPTLWCPPHKMSLSSAIIEHWADYYCAGVISSALSLSTLKVSCLSPSCHWFWEMFCQCSDAVGCAEWFPRSPATSANQRNQPFNFECQLEWHSVECIPPPGPHCPL